LEIAENAVEYDDRKNGDRIFGKSIRPKVQKTRNHGHTHLDQDNWVHRSIS